MSAARRRRPDCRVSEQAEAGPLGRLRCEQRLYGWGVDQMLVPTIYPRLMEWVVMPCLATALETFEGTRDIPIGSIGRRALMPKEQARFWKENAQSTLLAIEDRIALCHRMKNKVSGLGMFWKSLLDEHQWYMDGTWDHGQQRYLGDGDLWCPKHWEEFFGAEIIAKLRTVQAKNRLHKLRASGR